MQVSLQDKKALLAVSPAALSAYAQTAGWSRREAYRQHSHIYTSDTLPEIIVPSTDSLGDYASAVAALIQTFAQVSDQDELAVYRLLVTTDRDVIRIRAAESDDGSLELEHGVSLVNGVRDMVLAAACSLRDSQPVYKAGANREAKAVLRQMRLGQTGHGSFIVNLLTQPLPPPSPTLFEDPHDQNAPATRRMTKRLVQALSAVRRAAEQMASGNRSAFAESTAEGVSANLCEALAQIVEPFPTLDVGLSWAQTRPMKKPTTVVHFSQSDAALLTEAAQAFRARAPKPDTHVRGFVRTLKRGEKEADGTTTLKTEIDGQTQSVEAALEKFDYERAVEAHKTKAMVVLTGDLERTGQRWKLLNPCLERVLSSDEQPDGD